MSSVPPEHSQAVSTIASAESPVNWKADGPRVEDWSIESDNEEGNEIEIIGESLVEQLIAENSSEESEIEKVLQSNVKL